MIGSGVPTRKRSIVCQLIVGMYRNGIGGSEVWCGSARRWRVGVG